MSSFNACAETDYARRPLNRLRQSQISFIRRDAK